MKKILTMVVVFLVSGSLISCSEMNNQDAGTITGAVAGGLIGSTIGGGSGQALAIAAGALTGAYIGGYIGRDMDRNDRARMDAALENNRVGEPTYWRNSHSGRRYEVVPVRNVYMNGNQYCRKYKTIAYIDGRKEVIHGTACRNKHGKWKAVN